jgi:exopolysaccharide biosynthesis polyprenyl glycosylphosphotransferase
MLMISLLVVSDILAAFAAWVAAYLLRIVAGEWGLSKFSPPSFQEFLPYVFLSLVICPLVYSRMGLYGPKRTISLFRELAAVVRAVLLTWVLAFLATSLTRQAPLSRLMMLLMVVPWMVLATTSRAIGRLGLRYVRRRGGNLRSAAIIGAGRLGQKLKNTLTRNPWTGIVVRYFIDDNCPNKEIDGLEVHGPIDDTERILAQDPVDIVFVAMSKVSHEDLEEVVNRLSATNVDLRVVPDLLAVQFLRHEVAQLDDLSIITLTHSPQQGWNSLLKQAFDVVLSLLALILLAGPMLIIAISAKLTSRGPVFYRQARASIGGKTFNMLKFRTMKVDAEAQTGPVWTAPNDPRVTPFGRFLRRTSLDELPQLINVLVGDMSLVGPRPERPELIERLKSQIPRYMLRHQVKAGITGLAQIHGFRGRTSLRKRLQYDLFYIRNWSFGLDLWILLLTPFRGVLNTNAY